MRRRFWLFLSLLLLVHCGGSTHVIVGTPRPAIATANVRIYPSIPPGAEQIAQLQATSGPGWGGQNQTDKTILRLKQDAARLGANGIVLIGMDSHPSGGGMSLGAGQFAGHLGGGIGVGVPTTRKQATGIAIWVPAPSGQTRP